MFKSTKAIADMLGVSAGTVRNLANAGVIPAQRVGRLWRFDQDKVLVALAPNDHMETTPLTKIVLSNKGQGVGKEPAEQNSTYEEGEE